MTFKPRPTHQLVKRWLSSLVIQMRLIWTTMTWKPKIWISAVVRNECLEIIELMFAFSDFINLIIFDLSGNIHEDIIASSSD